MNTMKKIICFVITLVSIFSVCFLNACNSNQTDNSVSNSTSSLEEIDSTVSTEDTSSTIISSDTDSTDSSSNNSSTKKIKITKDNYTEYLNFSNIITYQYQYESGTYFNTGYKYITYIRTIQINITPLCDGEFSGVIYIKDDKWEFGRLGITLNKDGTGIGSISVECELVSFATPPNDSYYEVYASTVTLTVTI